jgi:PAS domain S-box-containing protein
VDDRQVYRFANRGFQEWYAMPDIIGRHLREVAGEQQYQGIRDYVDTALAGTPITFDYSRTYPDGRPRFVEIAYIPHVGPEGRVIGFFTLVQDLTERKVAEEQIKASLEEKVVLLKEIHHRVKNNLQGISSLLSLQAEQIGDPQIHAVLQDSQNRVRSMALIHEKLYQAKDQVRVNVAEYIQNLTSYLFRSYAAQTSGIQLKVKADNVYLGIDTAMPCGLIINELLSNALKHGFPNGRGGQVYVELRYAQDGFCTLLVGDNGIGMPAELDQQRPSSLGLQLVHTLVNQLDGSMEVRRAGGVEFCIRFAEAN